VARLSYKRSGHLRIAVMALRANAPSSSSGGKSNGKGNSGHDLPSWIFDVDDEDTEISMSTPLLQELEIDLNNIYQ
jgi:hypothetical protein